MVVTSGVVKSTILPRLMSSAILPCPTAITQAFHHVVQKQMVARTPSYAQRNAAELSGRAFEESSAAIFLHHFTDFHRHAAATPAFIRGFHERIYF